MNHTDKPSVAQVIVVEGKYDKIKLDSLLDATVIPCDGFCIFKEPEKAALLRRLARERGIIVLTDSDGAGLVIRNHLKNLLAGENVIHLYVPAVRGKEKRKAQPSKEGLLGVEGIDAEVIRSLFAPYTVGADQVREKAALTKTDLYEDGLTGGEGSSLLRRAFCLKAGLPASIGTNAFLEAINLLFTEEEYRSLLAAAKGENH